VVVSLSRLSTPRWVSTRGSVRSGFSSPEELGGVTPLSTGNIGTFTQASAWTNGHQALC
jgi:hypothetical protein